jgi:Outer membrane protein beta-barrel domain
MKKIIICLTAFLCTLYTSAQTQTDKGNFVLGGNINYTLKTYDNSVYDFYYSNLTQENSFTINPNIGYFVNKNLAIGADVFYAYQQQKYNINNFQTYQPLNSFQAETTESLTNVSTFGLGAYLNYYVPIIDKLSFFVNNSISFANGNVETKYSDTTISSQDGKISGFGIAVSPGLIYFVSPRLSFQTKFADLHYRSIKTKPNESIRNSEITDFGIGADSSTLLFGVNYYFK